MAKKSDVFFSANTVEAAAEAAPLMPLADYGRVVGRPYPRVSKRFNLPSKTRASEMASTDLRTIVNRFRLAGGLPPTPLKYGDATVFPGDRMELFDRIQANVAAAKESFDKLPLKVRQAVQHNPANLEAWVVSNPELAQELLKAPADVASSPAKPTSSGGAGEGEKGDPA